MLTSAAEHYRFQARLAAVAVAGARRAWGRVSFAAIDQTWTTGLAQTALLLTAAQQAAAENAVAFIPAALAEQGLPDDPVGAVRSDKFAGIASDGRPLPSLLQAPAAATKKAVAQGVAERDAMARGLYVLERIVATQVQDAGRGAAGVAIAVRPRVGYVRMLNPPSCSRCAVLAGKTFRFNQGFQRHPMCDCRHVPTAENVAGDLTTNTRGYFDSLDTVQQDRIFTKAGAEAIRDGADIGQVVNARRGMSVAGTTTEGIRNRQGGVRLMPQQIYVEANGDREEAIRLLRRFGYV